MVNPFEEITNRLNELEKNDVKIKCATVTSVSPFKCVFDGETAELSYIKPKNYSPVANDRVIFLCVKNKYVCLGAYE